MKADEATKRFKEADDLFNDGKFTDAMAILDELDAEYPGERNLMYARARTLGKIGREDEALALCDRLVSDFGSSRAARLQVKLLKSMTDQIDQDNAAATPVIQLSEDSEDDVGDEFDLEEGQPSRFQIKPVRLLLLIGIVALALTNVIHPYIAIGIVVAYFVVRWLIGRAIIRLFSVPFKMKAKALQGATLQLHDVSPVPNPDPELLADMEHDRNELRFLQLDVTVTPQPRTEGFIHWEPGELALAPQSARIKSLDDLDKCFTVLDVRFVNDGVEEEDEGDKVNGPARIKLLVGLPPGAGTYQFVYYTECFGSVDVPA